MVTLDTFRASLAQSAPPSGLSSALQAMWWAAKQDWENAHNLAQSDTSADGSWVHAYLHRVEGDLDNARYWYRRARQPEARNDLDAEWSEITAALLAA